MLGLSLRVLILLARTPWPRCKQAISVWSLLFFFFRIWVHGELPAGLRGQLRAPLESSWVVAQRTAICLVVSLFFGFSFGFSLFLLGGGVDKNVIHNATMLKTLVFTAFSPLCTTYSKMWNRKGCHKCPCPSRPCPKTALKTPKQRVKKQKPRRQNRARCCC